MKTVVSLKIKLFVLSVLSFIACIGPVAAVVIINRNEWFSTPKESVKIAIGAAIGLVLIIMKVLGKIKMPRRIIVYAIVFALAYLLASILNDLMLLSGMALLGEGIDFLFFQRAIKNIKEQIHIEKTAGATASQVEEIIDRYVGSGRT